MNCSTCSRPVPDEMLVCPVCFNERAEAGFRQLQSEPLRRVRDEGLPLTTRAHLTTRHVQAFYADPPQAMCGVLLTPRFQRGKVDLGDLARVCPRCAEKVRAIVEVL